MWWGRERSQRAPLPPAGTLMGGDRLLGGQGDFPPLLAAARGVCATIEPFSHRPAHHRPSRSPPLSTLHFACSRPLGALCDPLADRARVPPPSAAGTPSRAPPRASLPLARTLGRRPPTAGFKGRGRARWRPRGRLPSVGTPRRSWRARGVGWWVSDAGRAHRRCAWGAPRPLRSR